ncbi:MAG: protein kinase [Deltaproteobacteria bacterium]|nr:protein kinase [Deltaproteobacteria bacterium]
MDCEGTVLLTESDIDVPDDCRKKILSRFADVRIIGEGGMGVVYYGFDSLLERQVAVKFVEYNKSRTLSKEQEIQFRQECRSMARLSHPNVPIIFEAGESDGQPYFVMEYVEGCSLGDRVGNETQRSISEKLSILIQVGEALKHAHAQGVVHRDIKPDNIMIMPNGLAKLVDFGISKTIHHARPVLGETDYIKGSPFYMSPEQMQGKEVDYRADIFSYGVVCYELLTSKHPFFPNPNTRPGRLSKVKEVMLNNTPKPLSDVIDIDIEDTSKVWPALEAVSLSLSFCLETDPAERTSKIDELLIALKRFHQTLLKKSPAIGALVKQLVERRPRLLVDFTSADLRKMLSSARFRRLQDGEIIFQEGDRESRFYIVSCGRVIIFREREAREITLNTLEAGKCFGEVAFLDSHPRMAGARAVGDTVLFAVDQEVLKDGNVSFAAKLYKNLSIILAEKLRRAEDRLLLDLGVTSSNEEGN